MFINGTSINARSGATIPVTDPTTGDVIDYVPLASSSDANIAIVSSAKAFESWKHIPMQERVRIQKSCATVMRTHSQEVALILSQELGRPLPGCLQEIFRAAELLDVYAEEGLRLQGSFALGSAPGEKTLVTREPVGVVIAITPFNYPINLLMFKLGAALIAGCTVVAKPSDDTPLSTLKLAELFHAAGLPAGVFNVVTGDRALGEALVAHPTPRKIAFTGSIPAGKAIAAAAAGTLKRVTLELGGQSAAIVCADADLDKAAAAICRHAYANSGQFCYRVTRVYVDRKIADDFNAKLQTLIQKLTMAPAGGDGDLGPMVNERMFANCMRHIEDAKLRGAAIATGGSRLQGKGFDGGYYLPPTLVTNTSHNALIMTEETFGPVLGVATVETSEEALHHANNTPFGLAGFIFTRDLARGLDLCERMEAGSVWLNNIQRSSHYVPFGGMKQSGVGREKGRYGVEDYLEWKTIYLSYEVPQ